MTKTFNEGVTTCNGCGHYFKECDLSEDELCVDCESDEIEEDKKAVQATQDSLNISMR